jgi:hypothetical protein
MGMCGEELFVIHWNIYFKSKSFVVKSALFGFESLRVGTLAKSIYIHTYIYMHACVCIHV